MGSFSGADHFLTECGRKGYQCLAMSYSWGEEQQVITTLQIFEEKMRMIDLSTPPRPVQEAIEIARKMRVQYLWVDSLCVIQDDESDWVVKSSRMRSTYQNARCRIAVDAASDVYSVPHSLEPQTGSLTHAPDGQQCTLFVRNSKSFCQLEVALDDSEGFSSLLGYCEREIRWECKEAFVASARSRHERRTEKNLVSLQILDTLYEDWDLHGLTKALQKIVGIYTTR